MEDELTGGSYSSGALQMPSLATAIAQGSTNGDQDSTAIYLHGGTSWNELKGSFLNGLTGDVLACGEDDSCQLKVNDHRRLAP